MSCWNATRCVVLNGKVWRLGVMTLADYVELEQQVFASQYGSEPMAMKPLDLAAWCQSMSAYVQSAAGRAWWLERCIDAASSRWRRRRSLRRLRSVVRERASSWQVVLQATDGLVTTGDLGVPAAQRGTVRMDWGAIFRLAGDSRGWNPAVARGETLGGLMSVLTGRGTEQIVVADSWSGAKRVVADLRARRALRGSAASETVEASWCGRLRASLEPLLMADLPRQRVPDVRLDLPHGELLLPRAATECSRCSRQQGEQPAFELAGARERHWARSIARQVVEQLADEFSTNRRMAKR